MNKIILASAAFLTSLAAIAQNHTGTLPIRSAREDSGTISLLSNKNDIEAVLDSIESNNLSLKALSKEMKANQLLNKTGIALPDPEVQFDYLWGEPAEIGGRRDFNISQSIDFATVSGTRRKLADAQDGLLEIGFRASRMALLLEAEQICIDLTYCNALISEIGSRLRSATILTQGYEKQLAEGNTSKLEVNKIRLSLSGIQGELSRTRVEKDHLISRLTNLNGGKPMTFDILEYPGSELPEDFDSWSADAAKASPAIAYVRQNALVGEKKLALSKMSSYPELSAGYMSELVPGNNFRGISVCLSIPLWSNRNNVRQAKAALAAAQFRQQDETVRFYGKLRSVYERACGLKQIAISYKESLKSLDNSEMLKKALDKGEISLLDYIMETNLYYDAVKGSLAAERDYESAMAELQAAML